ncbi:MAG: hypothetical protein K9M11_01585 [Candidatus Pacebacteria bacterium]|nr:hypothetical protein [Candidatus Paceibacterota bacterium]
MKSKLLEHPLGSMLHKFFTQIVATHEDNEYIIEILWRAVSHYDATGEFSVAVIVCPQYSEDCKQLLSGVSLTAQRSINLFVMLKKFLRKNIRYHSKVHFRSLLFDQESVGFLDIPLEKAQACMSQSVCEIQRVFTRNPDLPPNFKAEKLVGAELIQKWQRMIETGRCLLKSEDFKGRSDLPFNDPDELFKVLKPFFAKVMHTDDDTAHRRLFYDEDGPAYLSAGHFLREKYGAHTLQIDVGSNQRFAKFNLWQPPGEELTELPALIRLKNPQVLDLV